MPRQKWWRPIRSCHVLSCLATALVAMAAAQPVPTPAPSGRNGIGTVSLHLVDASRGNPFSADGTKRELMLRFWYPSAATTGCRPAEYASARVWTYLSQISGFPLPRVTTHSCWNAAVAEGNHAVLIFSHGYTGTFTDSTFLFEDLASRGYVVVSIAHAYDSTAVEFPDGRLTTSVFGSYLNGDSLRSDEQSLKLARSVRLADLKFVLDQLQQMRIAGERFAGKLDMSRIGVMGHSLGAEVALSSLQSDPRLRTAVLLDPPIIDEDTAGTAKPVLLLAAGREHWSTNECTLWSNLRGPRMAVNLRGAGHFTPTDAEWMFKDAPGLISSGTLGSDKTIVLLRAVIAGFLDTHLRGAPVTSLSNVGLSGSRDALVTGQNQTLCFSPTTVMRGELR